MSAPLRLVGTVASAGYAQGPLFALAGKTAAYVRKRSAEAEAEALRIAIAAASEHIAALIAGIGEESAAILEFQLAMIEDEALSAPAFTAIMDGAAADAAWCAALDAEIVGYESSDNDYFRARAADLKDIRDQVRRALTDGTAENAPAGAILYGDDVAPTQFLETDWSKGGGIALANGSAASHVAMLARARGVPMLVGLGRAVLESGSMALLDAERGRLILHASGEDVAAFRACASEFARHRESEREFLHRPAATRDGTAVRVMANIADPADTDSIDIATCDGVGLMRTEFLFGNGLPDEETQYRAYRKVLDWGAGKPVTIRTVDAGGDKPVPGFTVEESNPFLGLRGVRLSLVRPEIFRVQIRALLRAAVHGELKVMLPMVSVQEELDRTTALFAQEAALLERADVAHKVPPLGIMVEVPAVAIAPEAFARADFFSIGSNDLTQYVMAAARDNGQVGALNSVQNPAVLRLIAGVVDFAARKGIPVSLCGDAGGDPAAIPALLKAGLRDLSVAPAQLAAAKAAIAEVTL